MKYSLKKVLLNEFMDASQQIKNLVTKICESELNSLNVNLKLVVLQGEKEVSVEKIVNANSFLALLVFAKEEQSNLKNGISKILKDFYESDNLNESQYSDRQIPLAAGYINNSNFKEIMLENNEDYNDPKVIASKIGLTSGQRESGSGLGRINKIVKANNLTAFNLEMFRFLYDKFINRSSWIDINKVAFEIEVKESLEKLLNLFSDLIQSQQALLTVNYGAFFEEYFNNHVYNIITNEDKEYDYNFEHSTKKLAIILTLIIADKFDNQSDVYNKIKESSNISNSDFTNDYKKIIKNSIRDEDINTKIKSFLENCGKILNIQDNMECNDVEKDKLIKDALGEISNSPFDFIIRSEKIDKNDPGSLFGFFDLKSTNKFVSENKRPLHLAKSGANKKNSALAFINNSIEKINEERSEKLGIGLFGLVQLVYEIKVNNGFVIEVSEIENKLGDPQASFNYSNTKSSFYIKSKENDTPSIIDKPDETVDFSAPSSLKSITMDLFDLDYKGDIINKINIDNRKRFISLVLDKDSINLYKSIKDEGNIEFDSDISEEDKKIIENVKKDPDFRWEVFVNGLIDLLFNNTKSSNPVYEKFKKIRESINKNNRSSFNKSISASVLSIYDKSNYTENQEAFLAQAMSVSNSKKPTPDTTIASFFDKDNIEKVKETILNKYKSDLPLVNESFKRYIGSKLLKEVYKELF